MFASLTGLPSNSQVHEYKGFTYVQYDNIIDGKLMSHYVFNIKINRENPQMIKDIIDLLLLTFKN